MLFGNPETSITAFRPGLVYQGRPGYTDVFAYLGQKGTSTYVTTRWSAAYGRLPSFFDETNFLLLKINPDLAGLHTITTHKKYHELLVEWAADNADHSDKDESRSPIPDATVLVAFRTRPPTDGEVEVFDASLADEETDGEEQVHNAYKPGVKNQPPEPRPVPKIPAQRPPEEFMYGITARPRRSVVHVPNMTVSVAERSESRRAD
ncbi:hypothetical protein C8R45DRAFT_1111577 [Mycena sanguinolenta]|nr:hypothetical protein C8R45DRAFT_1111577 [Mycena sanguinolenta]